MDQFQGAHVEDAEVTFAALGHYVYEFSRMIAALKRGIVESQIPRATQPHDAARRRVELEMILGESTASQLANAFFALARKREVLDLDELKIVKAVQIEVNDAITQRNDFLHGDWLIGYGGGTPESRLAPILMRDKPARAEAHSAEVFLATELEVMADRLEALTEIVAEISQIAIEELQLEIPWPSVRDVFTIKEKRVYRDGPNIRGTIFGFNKAAGSPPNDAAGLS